MVYIPKFKLSDVITGASDSIHPAFIINGKQIDGFWISKYQNVVQDSRAYSLPGEDPKASLTFDSARTYCETKGDGWHCVTRAEWAAIALWCLKNGHAPLGNNNYGKDTSESEYKAIPMTFDGTGKTVHVATGTGPLTWSHNGDFDGIWDLNGNVAEWQGGIRTVYGELQILADNNAADLENSQSATSAQWMAIDASTGELINPNGSGTTSGSIKMDWLNNRCTYSAEKTTNTGSGSSTYSGCVFANIACDSTIGDTAKELLMALCLLPSSATAADYNGDYFYFDNVSAERAFYAGGSYINGGIAGLFFLYGYNARSSAYSYVGFRSAYVNLPSE